MAIPFRNTAAFGKRMEYWIIGRMLKEGLDLYLPLVDDDAIDAGQSFWRFIGRKYGDGFLVKVLKPAIEKIKWIDLER